jgi:outer membrane protein assembly factor BamB
VASRKRRLTPRSPRARIALGVVVLGALALALGAYLYEHNRTGNIYNQHARFVAQPNPTLSASARFSWPMFGYSRNHARYYPAPPHLRPPFGLVWAHDFGTLLEFPPVMRGNHIFQLGDNGVLSAFNKYTGHVYWTRHLGSLSASSPAVIGRTVFATVLSGTRGGRVVALDYGHGTTVWSRDLPARSESSPLVADGRVYFGSQSGLVYALDASTGSVIWTYHAAGAVKASPTLSEGVLYFGDYSGQVQAISAANGHRIWISGSEGAIFGSGTFYSTAAVVYGRVFLGNTDGRVYAYDAATGKLDWAVQTGNYVYASPAVVNAPGIGPTVYVGSYNGTFYALSALSGHVEWSFNAHGRISGSATIVGSVVYFADLGQRRTYGLDISTGRVVFQWPSGSFDPVISDGQDLYLSGFSGIYDLAPR